MSPILVTVTSSSDYNFEHSNISLKENVPGGVDPNSDGHDYCARKNEGKILWFSADWIAALIRRFSKFHDEKDPR